MRIEIRVFEDTNYLSTRSGAHVEGGLVRVDFAPVSGHQRGNVIRQFIADDVDPRTMDMHFTVKSSANGNDTTALASCRRRRERRAGARFHSYRRTVHVRLWRNPGIWLAKHKQALHTSHPGTFDGNLGSEKPVFGTGGEITFTDRGESTTKPIVLGAPGTCVATGFRPGV